MSWSSSATVDSVAFIRSCWLRTSAYVFAHSQITILQLIDSEEPETLIGGLKDYAAKPLRQMGRNHRFPGFPQHRLLYLAELGADYRPCARSASAQSH